MSKKPFAVLLLSFFAALSFNVSAAETSQPEAGATEQVQQVSTPVNLNTADVATLQAELVGIGQVKAQAIVDHRTSNGPFASVDELLEVKGIGPATLEKNRARLSVN